MENFGPKRKLVEGTAIIIIYLIILAITVYLPLVGLLAFILLPLPYIYQTVRMGLRQAILLGVLCSGLSLLFIPVQLVWLTVLATSVGAVMGWYYKLKAGPFIPVLTGVLTYLINFALYIFLAYFLFQFNIFEYFEQTMKQHMAANSNVLLAQPGSGNVEEMTEQVVQLLTQLIPGWIILFSTVLAFLNHFAARRIFQAMGVEVNPLVPFRQWNFPKAILYYYLIALFILLVKLVDQESKLYMPVINLHFVLEILLLIQGLTLIAHFFYLKGIHRALVVILAGLSFIPFIASLIRIVGIIDLGFNLKERLNHALRS